MRRSRWTTFRELYEKDVADTPKVMETQRRLLETRYDLTPKLSSDVSASPENRGTETNLAAFLKVL